MKPAVRTLMTLVAVALVAGCASTDAQFAFRVVWDGPAQLISPDTDYQRQPSHPIDNGSSPFRFPQPSSQLTPETVEYEDNGHMKRTNLNALLQSTSTHAFIVIRDGAIVSERYFNGYQRDSICVSYSMAKSVTSALIGIAIDEGLIKGVNDPIITYLPELKGRGFDSITIRDLLNMGSGIRFNHWDDVKAYFYPNLRKLLLTSLVVEEPPGRSFHYNGYNPELLGLILERVTHRSPSVYLQEKIWVPLGMEYQATWSVDSKEDGFELMQSALNARAIDFAKFGWLFLNRGNWNGKQVISEQWVDVSTSRDPEDKRPWENNVEWVRAGGYYTYGWWGLPSASGQDDFTAAGKYGQYIFVSPSTRVVIVRTGKFDGIDWVAWPRVFQDVARQVASPGK